ncbi:hypothetical protein [Mycoplasma sp. P36-A1]|uniref:hypothetical protein n=1 Tax=Mycoplasma sp. P36-A1 TaxID=3252900 RepID=UPI003C2F0B83
MKKKKIIYTTTAITFIILIAFSAFKLLKDDSLFEVPTNLKHNQTYYISFTKQDIKDSLTSGKPSKEEEDNEGLSKDQVQEIDDSKNSMFNFANKYLLIYIEKNDEEDPGKLFYKISKKKIKKDNTFIETEIVFSKEVPSYDFNIKSLDNNHEFSIIQSVTDKKIYLSTVGLKSEPFTSIDTNIVK